MTAAQIHLALSHFPIAGIFLVIFFILLGFVIKKKELLFSAMILAILSGVAIIPMNLSGEGAEEIVEHKPGVTEELIHEHEESAEKSIVVIEMTAILAIVWLIADKFRKEWLKKLEIAIFLISIVSAFFIANTAHLGGMIRHDELRGVQVEKATINHDNDD